MRFIIFSDYYPYVNDPIYTFTREIAHAITRYGDIETIVIAPQNITRKIRYRYRLIPMIMNEKCKDSSRRIRVFSFPYLSFSTSTNAMLVRIKQKTFENALKRAIKLLNINKDDICYAIFIHMGVVVDKLLRSLSITTNLYVESSESEVKTKEYDYYNWENLKGFICVSTEKVKECKRRNLINKAPYTVIPNGFDPEQFYYTDKSISRKKLGIAPHLFIIAFVGSFIKRKGVEILERCIDLFDDAYVIFVGKGALKPNCKNILFCDSLEHNRIREYISCADVFVLPTLNEGCANVIVEALGCGLPVISSDRDFNKEILDKECAILIDPESEEEIYTAIKKLKEDPVLRTRMSNAALKKSETLTMEKRVVRILEFCKTN